MGDGSQSLRAHTQTTRPVGADARGGRCARGISRERVRSSRPSSADRSARTRAATCLWSPLRLGATPANEFRC